MKRFAFLLCKIPLRELARTFHWRDSIRLTAGTVGAQLTMVLTLPVLSRLYAPADFGVFAVVQSFATIFTLVSTLNLYGVTPTIPQKTFATRFTSMLLLSSLVWAVVLLVVEQVVEIADTELFNATTHFYARWIAAIGLSSTTFTIMRAFQIKLCDTRTVAAAQMMRSVVSVGGAVALALIPRISHHPGDGLIISSLLGDVTAVVWLFGRLPIRLRKQLIVLRLRRLVQEFWQRRKLILGTAWSHSLGTAAGQAPLWIVSMAFGATCAGWYALAYRVVTIPTSFVGATITGVLSSRMSIEFHQGRSIGRPVRLVIATLATFGVLGYSALALGAWTGTAAIFGKQWAGASSSLAIMSLLGFSVFLSSAINFLPIMVRAIRFLVIWSTVRVIGDFAALIIAWKFGWSYDHMVLFYAGVESLLYMWYVWFVLVASNATGSTRAATT